MKNITLRQLRAVAAVQKAGKIIFAANELGLSQPAVTLQLRDLEAMLGTQLFDRTSEGMRPTAAGLAVAEAAKAIEERLLVLHDEIDAIKGVRKGALRLGVVSTAKYFAPGIMAAFMKQYPDVDVSLFVGNRAETIASLNNHSVDVALMGRPPRELPVRAASFGEHPLVFVAPPDHPLARHQQISKERIGQEKFLVRERGSGTRISLEIFLGELPGRIDDLGTELDSNETIKQAVMAGLGLAFISGHTIAQEVELGRLVVLDVLGTPIRRQWFSVTRADRALSPSMVAFEAFLGKEGERFLPRITAR
ncbi:LysR family transcriptional regulator [Youhaiella tibetensis]|uniref:HTH-type transcriptional regulator CbbR n=1 Tax=Paradevosia tibetensis TaxID=1447062 RepID=A0A5B9DL98_9HYPH|nr:LysR family transcriptional regulator [Youhaiella tibetensis]QEE19943.1 LysR family transcriptional regulator [Youhaiella tibetensis]GGF28483.1 LysR family transcriptional regulator [Youhaiella tibetensis]